MFFDLETYLFPDSVCGIPFKKRNKVVSATVSFDDDEVNDDDTRQTLETIDSDEVIERVEQASTTQSLQTPRRGDMSVTPPLMPRAASDNTKRVRFAMDDEVSARRKRNQRNLRKVILQKSAQHKQQPSSSPKRIQQKRFVPSSAGRRHHGRRIRTHQMTMIGILSPR